jgi:hypothetical protein
MAVQDLDSSHPSHDAADSRRWPDWCSAHDGTPYESAWPRSGEAIVFFGFTSRPGGKGGRCDPWSLLLAARASSRRERSGPRSFGETAPISTGAGGQA